MPGKAEGYCINHYPGGVNSVPLHMEMRFLCQIILYLAATIVTFMKRLITLIFFLFGFTAIFAANREDVTVYPEISETFNAVKVGGEFRVVYCDAADTLKITANDKVIQNVECVVEDSTLIVRYREGKSVKAILGGRSPIVCIPANPAIERFTLSGTTRMESHTPFVRDSLAIELSGTSRVIGEVRSSALSVRCAGTVNVTLTGSADSVDIRIDGASRVAMGEGFECTRGQIDINGTGFVRLNCKEKLSGEIAGGAVVKYLGKPDVAIVTNGLASISAVD